jgi:hypothetical protein
MTNSEASKRSKLWQAAKLFSCHFIASWIHGMLQEGDFKDTKLLPFLSLNAQFDRFPGTADRRKVHIVKHAWWCCCSNLVLSSFISTICSIFLHNFSP